jgi:Family of unknown function (DUF5760)
MDKEQLKKFLQSWCKNDSEITELQKQVKVRKIEKKKMNTRLLEIMKQNEIERIDLHDEGTLVFKQHKVKKNLTKTAVMHGGYFQDTEKLTVPYKYLVKFLENNIILETVDDNNKTTYVSESKSELKSKSKSEPGTWFYQEPESKQESEPESKPESEPGTWFYQEPESKQESEPESKPESEPGTWFYEEPESKPELKPESKPESEPELKPESEPGTCSLLDICSKLLEIMRFSVE